MTSANRLAGPLAVATLALVLASGPVGASAMRTPSAGDLSPRLAELSSPAVRSAPHAVQAKELGLPREGAGSLLRRGNRVLAYVSFEQGAVGGLDALRAAGAQVVDSSRRYQIVTVAAKPDQLRAVGAVANVSSVVEALAPVTAEACPSGEVVSEGDAQLQAAQLREANPGLDGAGVTVGILSDSFDQASEAVSGGGIATHAEGDEASGDLPGPNSPCANKGAVGVLEAAGSKAEDEAADEGRAMAQIVHDLAPGAQIDFASAFNGETSFAKNIGKLAKPVSEGGPEAKVIADDVFYLEEPFFQDGPIAVTAREAVEGGATYLSAAGNDNLIDAEGNDIASWEAPSFRNSGGCPQAVQSLPGANGSHCMDFNPGSESDRTFGIKVEAGATLTVDLQWDEPWHGVKTDLDAFLLNASGGLIEVEGANNLKTQRPAAILEWVNESASEKTVQLAINRYTGGSPRLKLGLLENGSGVSATEYPRSTEADKVGPTIFGHSGSASVISMGAMPYNHSDRVEDYSSRGPVRHDFEPVESGTEAAEPLGAAELISKPDAVATDCGVTTFFAFPSAGKWRFCGTSAAAPHAAAIAALMLNAKPSATPVEIRAALLEGATPVGEYGQCAAGAGRIDAVLALEALLTPGSGIVLSCEPPSAEVSAEEAAAPGSWGIEVPPSASGGPLAEPPPAKAEEPIRRRLPRTFIRRRPQHLIRTHHHSARVVFRFGSNEHDVSFACRIDNGLFRPCPTVLVRRLPVGWHSLRVSARNAEGLGDRTPAFFRFRIKRVG